MSARVFIDFFQVVITKLPKNSQILDCTSPRSTQEFDTSSLGFCLYVMHYLLFCRKKFYSNAISTMKLKSSTFQVVNVTCRESTSIQFGTCNKLPLTTARIKAPSRKPPSDIVDLTSDQSMTLKAAEVQDSS